MSKVFEYLVLFLTPSLSHMTQVNLKNARLFVNLEFPKKHFKILNPQNCSKFEVIWSGGRGSD